MILKAKQIVKTYGKTPVLQGVSLSLYSGESLAITGRSGAGKTTLLHILGTLESPDSGEIEIAGHLARPSLFSILRQKYIGFVFQSYNLLEDFTSVENVLMPARIARKKVSKEDGLELLSKVGLESKALLPVKLLSGGERQRVAIARALCNDPSIILADEPTGNLDRANAQKISEILLTLGKSLIIVTHDLELASLCQQQIQLERSI